MKNKVKQKRTKLTTGTYMKEVVNYKTLVVKSSEDYYITIKKYIDMTKPIVLDGYTYIDKGYYMVEFTPTNDFYNIRFYVSNKLEVVDFYVDITLENGMYQNVPYYVDLYLDIIKYPKEHKVAFADENELLDALKQGDISKRDYKFAYKVGNRILEEIKYGKNKFLNMNIVDIVKNSGI